MKTVMTVDDAMTEMKKFLTEKNVILSESEKRYLEQLFEDLRQTGYSDGFDNGYFSGCYEEGDDFAVTSVDCAK